MRPGMARLTNRQRRRPLLPSRMENRKVVRKPLEKLTPSHQMRPM
jgi:hypothetical protein